MTHRPPLHIHLLAHPESEHATGVAEALMARFVEPPASGGLRVPVFFTPDQGDGLPPALDEPDGLNLDAAEHAIVVVLADARMARVAPTGTGRQWQAFIEKVIARAPVGESAHHVLPIALQPKAFELSGQRHFLPAMLETGDSDEVRERRLAEISLHIAARAIQLLSEGRIPDLTPGQVRAPVRLFISHAKADLAKNKTDPAYQTMKVLADLPIEHWFDAAEIVTSQKFEDEINAGIRDCTIMLAFHTDHYSSRPWCRREVLDAKKLGAHLLLVDALRDGEPRHFPYLGNVPTVRWRYGNPEVEARRVVDQAVLEALRFKHNRAQLEAIAEPDEIVLPTAPEALTVAFRYSEVQRGRVFLYPDPPLGREELEIINWVAPEGCFVTPLTKAARRERSHHIDAISVSISASNDRRRYGLSGMHQQTLSDEIHLYLLLAGLRIAYGGALSGDLGDAANFTLRLFELVRGYAKLAESIQAGKFHPIVNYAPWPLRLDYGDREWDLFGKEAEYVEGARPELSWADEEIFPPTESGWRLAPDTPDKRYAWARGLTAMREQITRASGARLVIGGNLRTFQGLLPGVVEEAWMSLHARQPLYLVGAFGGAARAVTDMLTGVERVEFDPEDAAHHVANYQAATACFNSHGGSFHSMAAIGDEIRALGDGGVAAALNNGLDDARNLELFACRDPRRVAELVLQGLGGLS